MGLFVEFDLVEDFGYLDETKEYGIVPDYSEGCQVFVETFLEIANQRVPVDTGYLKSTLTADYDDTYCYAETDCEYAQYPEFGTWCQEAQPYFSPALEEAIKAAQTYWDAAELEAIMEEQIQRESEQFSEKISEGFDGDEEEYEYEEDPYEIEMALGEEMGGGFFNAGFFFNLAAAMIVASVVAFVEAMIGVDFSSSGSKSNVNVYIPEIIIT